MVDDVAALKRSVCFKAQPGWPLPGESFDTATRKRLLPLPVGMLVMVTGTPGTSTSTVVPGSADTGSGSSPSTFDP